jgi:hypothetical protein
MRRADCHTLKTAPPRNVIRAVPRLAWDNKKGPDDGPFFVSFSLPDRPARYCADVTKLNQMRQQRYINTSPPKEKRAVPETEHGQSDREEVARDKGRPRAKSTVADNG